MLKSMQEEILNVFNNSMISWKIRLIQEKEKMRIAEMERMLKKKKMQFPRRQGDLVGRSTLNKDSSANMIQNSELAITKNVDTMVIATPSLPLNKTNMTVDSTPEISDWGIKIVETMSLATNIGGDSTEPVLSNTEAMDLMEIKAKSQAADDLSPAKIRIKNPASINSSIPKGSLPPLDVPETETGTSKQDFSPINNQDSAFISTESHSKKATTLSKRTLTEVEMPKQDVEIISSSEALLDLTGFEVPKSCSPNIKQKRKNAITVRGDLNDSIYLKTLDVQNARWTRWEKVNQVNPKRRVRKKSQNVSRRYEEYFA